MAQSSDYLRLLERWVGSTKRHMRVYPGRADLVSYGPGVHGHWSLQTHTTAFTAFSELAANAQTDLSRTGMSRDELWTRAFQMLRFTLHGHKSGSGTCVDGQQWGHSWISNLCIERMMHGVENMEIYLTDEDQEGLYRVLTSECDWLLDHYSVTAGLLAGQNKPESNMWNGSVLWRTALMYPDAPRAAEYMEKGMAFLLNATSYPQDAESLVEYAGKPLKDWHVGANFFESSACNHHGYMNVGYINITLSNLAMLHFSGRHWGWKLPDALYLHIKDVWPLTKTCVFPDGRLLRIGGDTRVRYCYCQDYAIAVWLLMRDYLGDTDTAFFEEGWLKQVAEEQATNADGSFMGTRLRRLEEASPLYYTRLEGDKAASLSMGACWHRRFHEFVERPYSEEIVKPLQLWSDDYHGSMLSRSDKRIASWTWIAGERPMGLCLPTDGSDLAEWRFNLSGQVKSTGMVQEINVNPVVKRTFEGGFITSGHLDVVSKVPLAEGESEDVVARTHVACVALPDDGTMVVLQRSKAINRFYFRMLKGLFLNVPNDVFNGGFRKLSSAGGKDEMLRTRPGRGTVLNCGEWLSLDDRLSVVSLNGQPLMLNRPERPTVCIKQATYQQHNEALGGWLYAEEICQGACYEGPATSYDAGDVLFEAAAAIRVGSTATETAAWAAERVSCDIECEDMSQLLHGAVRGADGKDYVVLFNVGAETLTVRVSGREICLEPGAAELVVL